MVKSKATLVAALLLFHLSAFSQVNRYMVFFKDKPTLYTIADPSPYLSAKAIQRRLKEHAVVTALDLPVSQTYIQQLRATGASVYYTTRWMNGALVQCDASLLSTLQNLTFVQATELVAPGKKLTGGRQKFKEQKDDATSAEALTTTQLEMIGLDSMQLAGYYGAGVTIAVLDAGFPGVNVTAPFQPLFTEGRVNLSVSHDFIANTNNIFQYDSHGTEVLSVIAALQSGTFTGGACKANFQLYVTEDSDSEYRIEEYNWLFAAERADSAGADVITTSLGYNLFDDASMNYKTSQLDGNTAVITRAAQFAADRGIAVISSAGNEGNKAWRTVTPPSDARDVLAVANVNSFGERSPSSSIGPTADGRIKPDVAALGTSVAVITPLGTPGSASGTSLAAPLITSLVAGLMGQFPQLTSKEIIAAIKHTASQATNPDNQLGYGIPNYVAVVNYLSFVPQKNAFEVYPNPVKTTVTIHPKSPDEISTATVELLSVQGQSLFNQSVNFNWLYPTYAPDLSTLAPGMYILRIRYNQYQSVHKIIKE